VTTEQRVRPILFSAPMVRALLSGRKTQTRRAVQFPKWADPAGGIEFSGAADGPAALCRETGCFADLHRPPFLVGDLLWVRETWQTIFERADGQRFTEAWVGEHYPKRWIEYAATSDEPPPVWRPSIFMPRKYSRITLRVTEVRCERLKSITEANAVAEGITRVGSRWEAEGICATPVSAADAYRALWEFINGPGSWDLDPWVWVVEFEKIELARAAA